MPRRALALVLALAACAPAPAAGPASAVPTSLPTPAMTPHQTPSPPSPTPAVVSLVGAGDIASCASRGAEATAGLLDAIPGTVFTAGDNAYESGTATEFARCYAPAWGRHRARTRPAPGNHDYASGGEAYFAYFGAAAGDPRAGWYSYDLGTWHVVVLNSNCGAVGGCGAGSPQLRWLREDLAAHPARCALAYWHHPRFSSGEHGSDPTYDTFWSVLYDYGVDVVVNGHDHDYERFAPQEPGGRRDEASGIRQFVVGTGGASLRRVGPAIANSEALRADTFGVLALTLGVERYAWRFVPVEGATFSDAGSAPCH